MWYVECIDINNITAALVSFQIGIALSWSRSQYNTEG